MYRNHTPKDKSAPKKGFYIKKLSDANSPQDLKIQSDQHGIFSTRKKPKGIRKKGSQIAKDARQRKKQYIKHLQQRNRILIEKNQGLQRQLKAVQNENKKAIDDKQLKIKSFTQQNSNFEGVASLFQNLYLATKNEHKQQIEKNLSLMRDKFGISGRNRIQQIEDLFLKITKALMPMHYRLLMQNCSDAKKFFELLSGKAFFKDQLFNDQQKRTLLNTRPAFMEAKHQYNKALTKLHELKELMIQLNYRYQRIVDKVQSNLTPLFVGKLLINLDQERNKQGAYEKTYPLNFWQGLFGLKNKSDSMKEQAQNKEFQQLRGFEGYAGKSGFQYDNDMQVFQHIYDDSFI